MSDGGSLDADCPILCVVTMPEVITLGAPTAGFPAGVVAEALRGFQQFGPVAVARASRAPRPLASYIAIALLFSSKRPPVALHCLPTRVGNGTRMAADCYGQPYVYPYRS
jgi:hypothetical protein